MDDETKKKPHELDKFLGCLNPSDAESPPARTPEQELVRMGAMYANAVLTLATVRGAAEDVLKAIAPHPKFQNKTRLVWAAELENLRAVLDNTKTTSDTRVTPTYEDALRMSVWIRGMMRLSEPEQIEIRAKIEALGAGTTSITTI